MMARRMFSALSPTLVLFVLTTPVPAQTASGPPTTPVETSAAADGKSPAASSAPSHPLSAKELRNAQIATDTGKLYELAQQLKVELDKSSKDTLSLTVVRKAAEIEKLAHTISDRMKSN